MQRSGAVLPHGEFARMDPLGTRLSSQISWAASVRSCHRCHAFTRTDAAAVCRSGSYSTKEGRRWIHAIGEVRRHRLRLLPRAQRDAPGKGNRLPAGPRMTSGVLWRGFRYEFVPRRRSLDRRHAAPRPQLAHDASNGKMQFCLSPANCNCALRTAAHSLVRRRRVGTRR